MVACELCRRAELTPLQRLREDVLTILGFEPRDRFYGRTAAYAQLMGVALTGRTNYDRHRDEYERTGDPQELQRMLRHVAPPGK